MSKDPYIHSPDGLFSPSSGSRSGMIETGVDYSKALARVRACVQHRVERLREESRQAVTRVNELLRQPQIRRQWMVRNSSRFRSWFVCDQLLEHCSKTWWRSPKSALEMARLALQVASDLDPEIHGGGPVGDTKALAFAYLGNCFRLMGRQRAAARSLRRAQESYDSGSGDQLLEARILTLKALLRVDEGKTGSALHLLEQAQELYFQTGDDPGIAKVLAIRGSLLLRAKDPLGAAWALRRSLRSLDPARSPDLHLKVRHALVRCALILDDFHQADRMLEATRDELALSPQIPLERCSRWFRSAIKGGLRARDASELLEAEPDLEPSVFWS